MEEKMLNMALVIGVILIFCGISALILYRKEVKASKKEEEQRDVPI